MRIGLARKWSPFARGLAAAALAVCTVQPALAQERTTLIDRLCGIFGKKPQPKMQQPYVYSPAQPQQEVVVNPVNPNPTPNPNPAPEPAPEPNQAPLASFGDESGAAVIGASAFNTPNIMGNFLGASKSVSFPVANTGGSGFGSAGSTSISNAKIADNNSPIPRDRVGYRYHFFQNTNRISGIGPLPDATVNGLAYLEPEHTQRYDTQLNGLEFEKTFFCGMASIDVRLPIVNTASSRQDLTFAVPQPNSAFPAPALFPVGSDVFKGIRTPDQSTGRYGTEIGNMQVIFKAIITQNDDFLLSGGVGVGLPTGSDTNVTVNDLFGAARTVAPAGNFAFAQRTRNFYIKNETWGLSPFLAFVVAPKGSRWFSQGFLEVEAPLNSNSGRFQEKVTFSDPLIAAQFGNLDIDQAFNVRESMLSHISWSTGFWLVQNPDAEWLKGIAPTFELHYTQSLTKGYSAGLQSDGIGLRTPAGFIPPTATSVGRDGNVTFLDVTLGSTFWIGNSTTLATGVSLPVLSGDNHRTYDAEFQVQLNWYFGPNGFARRPVPNF